VIILTEKNIFVKLKHNLIPHLPLGMGRNFIPPLLSGEGWGEVDI